MPGRFDAQVRVIDGNRAITIDNERKYHMGPAEGRWWVRFSWWVIPLGIILLLLPWLMLGGLHFSWGSQTSAVSLPAGQVWTPVQPPPAAPPPQVMVNVPDHVNVRIEPAPTPAPAPEPSELSPEELDRRHTEALRRRGQ